MFKWRFKCRYKICGICVWGALIISDALIHYNISIDNTEKIKMEKHRYATSFVADLRRCCVCYERIKNMFEVSGARNKSRKTKLY